MFSKFSKLVLGALAAGLLALPSYAQSSGWKVDTNRSYVRIDLATASQGSGDPVTLGAASPSGILHFDSADPSKSTFQFALRPSGAAAGDASIAQSPVIRFRSESAALTPDGQLKVTGTLTVSRVVLIEDFTANEGYSGPVVTGSRLVESSRQESFILPVPADDPRDSHGNAYLAVSTSLQLNAEDFPELYDELLSTNWPGKAQDVVSENPSSFGEDYSGTLRTGTNVQTRSITRTATSFGEDYPGDGSESVQPGHVVTLALNLHLVPQGASLSAKNGQ